MSLSNDGEIEKLCHYKSQESQSEPTEEFWELKDLRGVLFPLLVTDKFVDLNAKYDTKSISPVGM